MISRKSPCIELARICCLVLVSGCGSEPTAHVRAAASPLSATTGVCYTVQGLGPVYFEGVDLQTLGLGPQGAVVGTRGYGDERRGFVFENGTPSPVGDLGGGLSDVRAVNARGLAVGGSKTADGMYRAASFYKGAAAELGALEPDGSSWSMDVNDLGLAVGTASKGGTAHAVAFRRGQVIDLGTIPTGGDTYANGVNDAGDIVGVGLVDADNGVWQAFLIPAGRPMQKIGTIDGAGTSSRAYKVNSAGVVCGAADAPGGYHGFLYRDGTMTDLGALEPPEGESPWSMCMDVSDTGIAVGVTLGNDWWWHPFVWSSAEGIIDLNTRILDASPDLILFYASNINSVGQITVYGVDTTTWENQGVLLSPVTCP
ncbi:hypothetical protein AMOR_55040 [Anaeromyxobacter oryzae]|uniref:Extracellular repeat protein, HAF family n=2 Tax=Anaeromyxobacter oryzae TaxID=2918170 RepID=A0ABN6N3T4_9BACT|nr:hypothetical protein AMOR_55040 [Anaeromyxobacter oryzae]